MLFTILNGIRFYFSAEYNVVFIYLNALDGHSQ